MLIGSIALLVAVICLLCLTIIRRKQASAASRTSEKQFRDILEKAAEGILIAEIQSRRFRYANPAIAAMLGYSQEELLRMTVSDIHPRESLEVVLEKFSAQASCDKILAIEVPCLRKDGSVMYADINTSRMTYNNVQCNLGFFTDITDRQRAEQERSILIAAIEQAQDAILISNKDGIIQYVNAAFERILGYERSEVIGLRQSMFAQTPEQLDTHKSIWDIVAQGTAWSGMMSSKRKNGSQIQLEVAVTPIRSAAGAITSFVSIARDISKEQMMEEQLRQSQKMEAIGTLAGGIAHDFNNILAAVIGYTEMTLMSMPDGNPLSFNLEQVLRAADRAREMVKQILAFSRKNDTERKPLELHHIVKEAIKLLRATLPSTIEIVTAIQENTGCVIADPTQIHQVLLNLCTNAAHAMREKGGTLSIGLSLAALDEADAAGLQGLQPGTYVQLTVQDTGTGIDPAILDRVFDPFFTTKDMGTGTGMGLSVVHGIVKSHGGAVTVASRLDAGTTFTIWLPSAENPAIEAPAPKESFATGTECILFVDDESALVQLCSMMLSSLGYTVISAPGGPEALGLFRKEPTRFDLVITDQTMPRMTGVELAGQLQQLRSDIPIILCTGYSEAVDAARAKSLNIHGFIMKPVTIREIAKTVRMVLDRNRPG